MDETEKGETEGSFKQPKKVIVNMVEPKKEQSVTEPAPKVEPIKKKHHWTGFKTLAIALLTATTVFSLTAVIATVTTIKPAKGDPGETGATGPVGSTGATGETGSTGSNGTNGTNGLDGKSVLTGETVPSNALGNDGDSYLNTVTFDYYLKVSGSWVKKGCLQGSNGAAGNNGTNGTNGTNGIDGTDGASVLTGTAAPITSVGVNGDSYVNTSTFDYYVKESGAWVLKGNIKGSNGSNGSNGTNGNDGTDGTNGANGKSVLTGITAPNNNDGVNGDSYVNTTTFDYYVKESGAWVLKGNIKGTDGTNGTNGTNGTSAHWYLDIYDDPTTSSKTTGAITGDNYMDTKTGEVFTKGDSGWSSVGNLHALTVEVPVTISFNNGFDSLPTGHGITEASGTPLADVVTTAGSFITLPTASAFVIPTSSIYSFVGFYTSDGVRWSDDMPVYKTTTLTAKWVDLGEYFTVSNGALTLVKEYPYSEMILPENYQGQIIDAYAGASDISYEKNIVFLYSKSAYYRILANSFKGAESLSAVLLDEKSIYVGANAFEGCSNLRSVTIYSRYDEDSLIDENAFDLCPNLRSVIIKGVNDMEAEAFKSCSALMYVTLNQIGIIGSSAFADDSALNTVSISNTVGGVEIYDNAFNGTSTSNFGLNGIGSISQNAFEGAFTADNSTLRIYGNGLYIDSQAFLNCLGITSVVITGTCSSICGFEGCTNLKRITADYCNSINSSAFKGCTSLTTVTIKKGLKSISGSAFRDCDAAKTKYLYIDDSLVSLDENAFATNTTTPTYLSLMVFVNGELTIPSSFYSKGIKNVYNHVTSWGDTTYGSSSEFIYTSSIEGQINTIRIVDSPAVFDSSLLDHRITVNIITKNPGNIIIPRVIFGSSFYSNGNFASNNSKDYMSMPDNIEGADSGTFTQTAFDDTKYYYVGTGFKYGASNIFERKDVVFTSSASIPSTWASDMTGDTTQSNIITGFTSSGSYMQAALHNDTETTKPVAVVCNTSTDSYTGIIIGCSPYTYTTAPYESKLSTSLPTSYTKFKLMAHPYIRLSATPITYIELPTNIVYIGSAFFEGVSSTVSIKTNMTKANFDAMTKASDWNDLGNGTTLDESQITFEAGI